MQTVQNSFIRISYLRYTKKKSKKFKKKFELEASNALRELRDALVIHTYTQSIESFNNFWRTSVSPIQDNLTVRENTN